MEKGIRLKGRHGGMASLVGTRIEAGRLPLSGRQLSQYGKHTDRADLRSVAPWDPEGRLPTEEDQRQVAREEAVAFATKVSVGRRGGRNPWTTRMRPAPQTKDAENDTGEAGSVKPPKPRRRRDGSRDGTV